MNAIKPTTGQMVLDKILSHLHTKSPTFAKTIGISRSNLYGIRRGATKVITEDLASQIIRYYPQFSKSWLMTGEGDMLIEKENPEPNS